MDFAGLPEDKQAVVAEFRSITDTSEDDTQKAIRLLDLNDWDLNNSIVNFFESGFVEESHGAAAAETLEPSATATGVDTSFSYDQDSSSTRYSTLNSPFDDLIPRLPYAPRISNNWQLEVGIHASRKDLRESNMKTINSILFVLLFVPNKLLSFLYHVIKYLFKINTTNYFPSKIDYELVDLDYKPALPEVSSKYNIVDSNFNQVYEDCKLNYTWLLVILVNNSEQSTNFLNKLLSNRHFEECFSKENHTLTHTTCIYINNVDKNPEAYEVGKIYKVRRLPYIMLINNVSNNPSVMASMSITYRLNGASGIVNDSSLAHTNKLSNNLNRIVQNYQPQIIAAVTDKREMEYARMLKQQQDDAYQKSLEQDKIKKIEKTKVLEKQRLHAQRRNFLLNLKKQDWFSALNSLPNTRIQIKLPDGDRLILNVDNQIKLRHLYLHLETKLFADSLLESEEEPFTSLSELEEYLGVNDLECLLTEEEYVRHFPFKFELVQPYPKKVFDDLDGLVEQYLKGGATLLVEYVDEDE